MKYAAWICCLLLTVMVIHDFLPGHSGKQFVTVAPDSLDDSYKARSALFAKLNSEPLEIDELRQLGNWGDQLNLVPGETYNPNQKIVGLQNALIVQVLLQMQSAAPQTKPTASDELKDTRDAVESLITSCNNLNSGVGNNADSIINLSAAIKAINFRLDNSDK